MLSVCCRSVWMMTEREANEASVASARFFTHEQLRESANPDTG